MSEREHMSQERMEAVRNNLDSFKFCASWFHNLLDEAQRLSREATALRQQRDALREALRDAEFRADSIVASLALVLEAKGTPQSIRPGIEQVANECFEIAEKARAALAPEAT